MEIKCDACSNVIEKSGLAMLSWLEDDGVIKNFKIHHKHDCDFAENNRWVPLYLLTNPKVLCNLMIIFLRKWGEGESIQGAKKLEKILLRLFPEVIRDLKAHEERDWIGYTNRLLPLKFPGEEDNN